MSNEMRSEVPLRARKGQVLCYHQASSRTEGVPGTWSGAQECSPLQKVSRKYPPGQQKGQGSRRRKGRGPGCPLTLALSVHV